MSLETAKHLVDFRRVSRSQIFNRAEVKLVNERIRFFQNLLQRIKSDSVFYQQLNNSA